MQDRILRRDQNVVVAEVEGRSLLLNMVGWTYLSLNETGARIWQHLETPRSRGDLLRLLEEEFDADASQLAADLDLFLGDLKRQGFICAVQ